MANRLSLLLLVPVVLAAQDGGAAFFDARVEPILRGRCLGCHNNDLKDGGVSFLDRDGLLKGGGRGPTIVPGNAEKSLLIQAVRQQGDLKMPPGAKLSPEDIATLTEWIDGGAAWGTKLRPASEETWTFDRIDALGGHPTTVLGQPHVIDTPEGKAVEFNGRDDALYVDVHPLAGAERFTWEVIFRPDADGAREQRFFHLQERDPQTGRDTATRLLFETRIVEGRWCLDSFALSGHASATLLDCGKLHPLGAWYHVAMVYDGSEFRNYVDGELQGRVAVHLTPQGQGHTSVGVRINRVDYFKGAIRLARMTREALSPSQFLPSPAK